jgi:SPP1 gp7 family putative phage head morphogenesis protein
MIKDIYNGNINVENLPIELYKSTANKLLSGVEAGAKIDYINFEFGELGKETALLLRENIYLFSGAKTFNYVLETQNLIIRDGKIIPYKEFEQLALAVDEKFNKRWLQVEYSDAQISAKNKLDWQNLQNSSEAFPLLRYVAFMDKNTSEICRRLNGIVKPTNDPFWNTYKPQNHYQCRCDLEPLQSNEAVETNLNSKDLIKPTPYFSNLDNDTIFNKLHPYFDVDNKYKAYAKNNFNLPIPKLNEPEKVKDTKPKIKNNKVKIDGYNGEHTYGTLTGEKLKTQKDIESKLGIKVPDKLLENIPNNLNIRYSKVNAYWQESTNTICLDTDQRTKLKNLTHEFGHLNHHKLKQIYVEDNKRKYSKEFTDLYQEFVKEIKEKGVSDIDKICKARKEVDSIFRSPVLDCIGEASNGVYGGGHSKKYYKESQRGVEFFAHISENYFMGNNFFKELLPNTYKLGNAYMKNILND